MQKLLIIIAVTLLLAAAFFMQQNTEEPVSKKTYKKEIVKDVVKNVQYKTNNVVEVNKQFKPTINLSSTENSEEFNEIEELKKLNSLTERELEVAVFTDLQVRMTKEMQGIPSCLEDAQNSSDALVCTKKLEELHREFELLLGISNDISIQADNRNLQWDENIKEQMIKEVSDSIQPMQDMFSCIQTATTQKERDDCFEVDISGEDLEVILR